jgi:hypothetical protein
MTRRARRDDDRNRQSVVPLRELLKSLSPQLTLRQIGFFRHRALLGQGLQQRLAKIPDASRVVVMGAHSLNQATARSFDPRCVARIEQKRSLIMTLTPEQLQAIQQGQPVSLTVEQTECVLVRKDVFQKIRQVSYDDSDWSDDELEALAAQTFDAMDGAEKIE